MKRRRRGDNGGVHVYKPPRARTFWIRYAQDGVQRRRNTGLANESQARIFAATAARMIGLAQCESLDEQRKLLEIAGRGAHRRNSRAGGQRRAIGRGTGSR